MIFLKNKYLCVHATNDTYWAANDLPDEKRLVQQLISRYGSKSVRPVLEPKNPVDVAFSFNPSILSYFNEQDQHLSIVGSLFMGWVDQMLVWNPDDHGGVERISLRADEIWLPDIVSYERLTTGESRTNLFETYVIVNSTGYVTYYDLSEITVYCRLKLTLFPLDIQACPFKFGSYNYDSEQLVLSYPNTSFSIEKLYSSNGVWQLDVSTVEVKETLYLCCEAPYVEIIYTFSLTRIGNFYLYSICLPCGLLSMLNIAVFVMHPNSGEKVTLSVNNVLAFVLFQQLVLESMPRSGIDTPIIVVFFSAMITISCLTVLGTAVVLRLYHHDPKKPVPRMFTRLIVRRKTPNRHLSKEDESLKPGISNVSESNSTNEVTTKAADNQNGGISDNSNVKDSDNDWKNLALALDKILLFMALFAMLLTVLYCIVSFWYYLP
ncbi:neuronal acetylcholine receptor subunit alpha-7-like isoform X2 [Apostichopus japonicus]|uniref:neuronal acetylcholine receptor subunit alpha-7-like isoform X2 n=1 Tax=Stichopus japonicus TaxID=307972 RepID=UPI003AB71E52